ncbi:hypothetical protein HZC30_03650 [Candidatus Woesearchaeota archaeon]|nr:hypothetical protein [Candidatus Woesearchaeota archaeon]
MSEKARLIKPAWNETLKFLAGMLDEEKAVELIEEISKSYLEARKRYFSEGNYDFKTFFNHSHLLEECLMQKQYFHMHKIDNNRLEIAVECENAIIREAAKDWIWASINPYDLRRVSIPSPQCLVKLGGAQLTPTVFKGYIEGVFESLDDLQDIYALPVWDAIFKSLMPTQREPFIISLEIMGYTGDQRALEVLEDLCFEDYLGGMDL